MQNKLQKAIDLVRKTGDRLLVYDMANPENAFAVMSIDEYEKLMIGKSEVTGLTEEQLLDKINRDIAIWKSQNDQEENEEKNIRQAQRYLANHREKKSFTDKFDLNKKGDDALRGLDDDYFDPNDEDLYDEIEANIGGMEEDKKRNNNPWAIPPTRKEAAEEIIDEDTQYLEEVK